MSDPIALVELAGIALALSSTVWVLGIQAVGLLRAMPRARFLPLQMSLVRVWSRALAVIVLVIAVAATLRAGPGRAAPAFCAFVAAAICARWAVPRALRSGAAAARDAEGEALSAGGFIADGGGAVTRVWHRVVLGCVAAVVAGLSLEAHALIGGPPHRHDHPASTVAASHPASEPRTRIDRVTAENIEGLEREAAAALAAGGAGEVTAIREGWRRIFAQCTTEGAAHERLHEFLAPLVPVVARVEAETGAARRQAVRELLRGLGRFDATFEAAP